jgi:hypothetical protein
LNLLTNFSQSDLIPRQHVGHGTKDLIIGFNFLVQVYKGLRLGDVYGGYVALL